MTEFVTVMLRTGQAMLKELYDEVLVVTLDVRSV